MNKTDDNRLSDWAQRTEKAIQGLVRVGRCTIRDIGRKQNGAFPSPLPIKAFQGRPCMGWKVRGVVGQFGARSVITLSTSNFKADLELEVDLEFAGMRHTGVELYYDNAATPGCG